MKFKLLGLLFLALFFLPGFAVAQDVVAWPCNGCTHQQMRNAALRKPLGTHYIYNLPAGLVVGYQVTREDFYPGVWTKFASPFTPPSWIIDQYAGIHQYYLDNNSSLISAAAASPTSANGGYVNGYDVVNSSIDRNRVANAIANNPRMTFTSVMASFGRVIRLAGVATPDAELIVKVSFPDGSSAMYKFNWDTKQWEYVPKSAIDSHGNSIPETASDFTNNGAGASYDFAGPGNYNDVNDFIRRASLAGVSITSGTRWACTSAANGVPRCVPY